MTKITVQIGSRSETFVLIQTNAPQSYDYGGAIELYDGTVGDKIERYVLIPEGTLESQRGRNASGLHSCNTEDTSLDEAELSRYLWQRLYREGK